MPIHGGPPLKDFRNQNARLLDDIRIRAGIPLGQEFGLETMPRLQPVFVVNPDAAPLASLFGQVPFGVAANAGFRSECMITAFPDRNIVVEAYLEMWCAAGVTHQLLRDITVAGFTQINSPPYDSRLPTPALPGAVFVGTKNTAAATAGGTQFGTGFFPAAATTVRFGPFYLDGALAGSPSPRNTILIRPSADNVQITGMWSWRALQRQPT